MPSCIFCRILRQSALHGVGYVHVFPQVKFPVTAFGEMQNYGNYRKIT